ncbi:MAG: sugar phosphate nucleotidyltransferase, partial [Patescibacteria group bacterium]
EVAGLPIFNVGRFIEKPARQKAKKFVENWEYLWNAGYFIFNGPTMAKHFATLLPETTKLLQRYIATEASPLYHRISNQSFDTAIVEKLTEICVIPADLDWSDIGSWSALHKLMGGQNGQTVARGNFHGLNNQNCLVLGDKKLIAAIGLKDLVIIDTEDATLICHQDAVHEVRNLVKELKTMKKTKYL